MAAVAEIASEAAVAANNSSNTTTNKNDNNNNLDSERNPKSESEFTVQKLVDMFTKLNPLAKEFFPSSYNKNSPNQFHINNFPVPIKQSANDNFPKRRRNDFNQGRRRLNGRAYRAQREDSIRRTVYVSDIDQHVTEEQLAGLFSGCGQVVDCRICGDPRSVLRFAFVEFAVERELTAPSNILRGKSSFKPWRDHARILSSQSATFKNCYPSSESYISPSGMNEFYYGLLKLCNSSEDEREMCTRTVYCTNIEKKVSQAEVKNFFESICGEVTRLRLLGDHVHSTRIAFVEFALAESAIAALNCSGMVLGSQPVRVSPSKTPVRPRVTRPALH
ncbi:hypothetical protein POTOM_039741 [Populus tomentosa]|uniref:RRM domain-containing protein n=1 Tax=Populus tomentosa TaxID=118781 RepID=A0A8X7YS92_POPTO|nr:hypothetical protein POTOM_039741 [Populus tomentosa]